MSGNKNSGRHGYKEEANIQEIIKLSTLTILQYLKSPDYPLEKKAQLASMLAVRRISDKKEVKQEVISKEAQGIIDRYIQRSLVSRDEPIQIEHKDIDRVDKA